MLLVEVSYLKMILIGDVVQLNDKTTSPGTLGIVEEVKDGFYTALIPQPEQRTTWYRLARYQLEYIGVAALVRKR